jgi:hypothetical protein
MMTPDVTHVQTLQNYELLVSFADGERRCFSMLPYLQYPAYRILTQPGQFGLAHVSNGTVAWSDEIDMSPDTLYIFGKLVSAGG